MVFTSMRADPRDAIERGEIQPRKSSCVLWALLLCTVAVELTRC